LTTFDKISGKEYDAVVIGCGLSGAVLAERMAYVLNWDVLIIEKRNHIAGYCYDFIDPKTGILMNAYGPHIFHTDDERVWEYLQGFSEWVKWEHRVIAKIPDPDGKDVYVPVPVNIDTVNQLTGSNITSQEEMVEWLKNNQEHIKESPRNGEQVCLSQIGRDLYQKMFESYTIKQWGKHPKEMAPEVLARIPVYTNFESRYFTDGYEALPKRGYTKLVEKMITSDKITIVLNTDFFDVKDMLPKFRHHLLFTGPIDRYFSNAGYDSLEYRSIKFIVEHHDKPYYQSNSIVNYPGLDVPFTRIVEYKHFLNQISDKTVIVKEIGTDIGEPYYPVLTPKNLDLYEKYQELAKRQEPYVLFIGRLANYKYFNMDAAISNALFTFDRITHHIFGSKKNSFSFS
jgi:UDP-galactopyranose mutase